MRSLLLGLVLANLLFAVALSGLVGPVLAPETRTIEQISPEKLRLVRDATIAGQPSSGTKSR